MSTVESLQACMKQEDALITEFAAILEAETEVLVGPGDIDALHDITERKSGIAHKLVELSQTRDALLAEIGLPAGHAGTEQAAAQHPQLAGVWQALLSKSESANEINLRNGALIDVHLRYTQQSLDARAEHLDLDDAQGRGTPAASPSSPAERRERRTPSFFPASLPTARSAAVGHLQHRVHLQERHRQHAAGQLDAIHARHARQGPLTTSAAGECANCQQAAAGRPSRPGAPAHGRHRRPARPAGIGHVAETGLGLVLQHQPPRDRAGIGLRSRQIGQAEELRHHLAADRIDQARAHQSHRRFAGPARQPDLGARGPERQRRARRRPPDAGPACRRAARPADSPHSCPRHSDWSDTRPGSRAGRPDCEPPRTRPVP